MQDCQVRIDKARDQLRTLDTRLDRYSAAYEDLLSKMLVWQQCGFGQSGYSSRLVEERASVQDRGEAVRRAASDLEPCLAGLDRCLSDEMQHPEDFVAKLRAHARRIGQWVRFGMRAVEDMPGSHARSDAGAEGEADRPDTLIVLAQHISKELRDPLHEMIDEIESVGLSVPSRS